MKRRELVGKMTALASGGFLLSAPGAKANTGSGSMSYTTIYDVRKYGAKADGKTNDAAAIQKAIDACNKGGGGVVLLDKGIYLSGGIKLKDHVELHVGSTATLLGSKNISDYNHDKNFKQGDGIRSFINADKCQHIAITGPGKIDGRASYLKLPMDILYDPTLFI
jgi:polygalacturonase